MYVEHPYKFNDKFYAKVDGKFYEITREVAKATLRDCFTVGEKKKYQKIDDNGELVIEWKKEKSIKDVVVENICYD